MFLSLIVVDYWRMGWNINDDAHYAQPLLLVSSKLSADQLMRARGGVGRHHRQLAASRHRQQTHRRSCACWPGQCGGVDIKVHNVYNFNKGLFIYYVSIFIKVYKSAYVIYGQPLRHYAN